MRLLALAAAISLPTFVCAIGTSPTSPSTLIIRAGHTGHAGGIVVIFHGVMSDSRCPLNVLCVSAGEATAEFTVDARGLSGRYQLQLNDPARRTVTHRGLVLEFQRLDPYPVASQATDPGSYRATIDIR